MKNVTLWPIFICHPQELVLQIGVEKAKAFEIQFNHVILFAEYVHTT